MKNHYAIFYVYVGPPTFSLAPQWPPTFFILESPLSATAIFSEAVDQTPNLPIGTLPLGFCRLEHVK